MALKIQWYKKAETKFDKILKRVEDDWGKKSAKDLIQKVNRVFDLLTKYPELGTVEVPDRNIRGILIVKQLRIFYVPGQNSIKIIQVFDTRENPKRKPK